MAYYGFDKETAREILSELNDLTSLKRLTEHRAAPGGVSSTAPDLHG
jgi:hypothetical protein